MKRYKGALIIATLLFLVVNLSYYWYRYLGFYIIPVSIVLAIIYVSLAIYLVMQISNSIKDKFSDKKRLFTVIVLAAILGLIFAKPFGMIDFEKLSGKDLLVAEREGAANCLSTFRLKNHNNFTFKTICFGSFEANGSYNANGDTIFFKNVTPERGQDRFYEYGIIKTSYFSNKNITGDLYLYKNKADTSPYILWIILNNLPK